MEQEEKLRSKEAGEVIISSCALWKYISVISIILFIVTIIKPIFMGDDIPIVIALCLFMLAQFFCLRLNLDFNFFKILYSQNSTDNFDEALKFLFNKQTANKSYTDRWNGTKKLIINLAFAVIIQFIYVIIVY